MSLIWFARLSVELRLPVAVRQCPLFGALRTQLGHRTRSEKCQNQTFAYVNPRKCCCRKPPKRSALASVSRDDGLFAEEWCLPPVEFVGHFSSDRLNKRVNSFIKAPRWGKADENIPSL